MIAYGLGLLPLIRDLRMPPTGVIQPWYADDAGASGSFAGIPQHLNNLMVRGDPRGYLPERTKSILIVSLQNVLRAEDFFRGYSPKTVTGSRYLGGFMGTEAEQAQWLEDKVERWQSLVAIMSGVSGKHPQTTYVGLHKSLQKEWNFVQRVTL